MKSEATLAVDKQLHEIKPHGTALFSFATYRMINPSDTLFVTSHWHREVEILCFQKGCAQVLLSGREYPVKAGDILFVNQGELHQISSTDPGLLYHACDFPLDFLCFAGYDYAQSNYLDPLSDKELFFPTLLSHDSPAAVPVYEELLDIIETFDRKLPGYELRVKASLLKVISCLIQNRLLLTTEEMGKKANAGKDRQLKEIVSYIQEHYDEKLYLEDIADAFHMSGKYFSRYFKQNFGRNFVEYLNNFRIEKACTRLASTDMTILEISLLVGFDNLSYFIRKFKEITGFTPSSYRDFVTSNTLRGTVTCE